MLSVALIYSCTYLAIIWILLANAQSAQVQQLLSAVYLLIVIMCSSHKVWVVGTLFSVVLLGTVRERVTIFHLWKAQAYGS